MPTVEYSDPISRPPPSRLLPPPVVSTSQVPTTGTACPGWCAGSRHLHRLDRSHRQPSNGARTPLRVRFVRQQQVGFPSSLWATFRLLPGYSKKPLPNGSTSRVTPAMPWAQWECSTAPHQCRSHPRTNCRSSTSRSFQCRTPSEFLGLVHIATPAAAARATRGWVTEGWTLRSEVRQMDRCLCTTLRGPLHIDLDGSCRVAVAGAGAEVINVAFVHYPSRRQIAVQCVLDRAVRVSLGLTPEGFGICASSLLGAKLYSRSAINLPGPPQRRTDRGLRGASPSVGVEWRGETPFNVRPNSAD